MKSILLLLLVALIGISGCAGVRARQERIERIHESLTKGVNYILSKQDEDGSWKSETYGCFREGTALTPFIMSGLLFLPQGGKQVEASFHKGVEFMVNMIDEDGNIQTNKYGMNFPVYTAASASRVVVLADKSPRNRQAQAVWLDYLLKLQFSELNGWNIDDPEYGGWGFFPQVPTKPASGVQRHVLLQANLSTTTFSIGALRSAKVPMDDPVWEKALLFVKRCQNFPQNPDGADSHYDDGGFYFCPHDPLQNKAGVAGTDKYGVERYNSYGSMTGDGVRALLQCGFEPDHPRVVAARKWLEQNFNAKIHPGAFPEDREVLRQATYYYYVWSIAHAFTRLGVAQIESPEGNNKWAEVLADELIRQQRPDGSWVNQYTDAKEDDPLVATPWAAAALANCLHVITHPEDLTGKGCPRLLSKKNLQEDRAINRLLPPDIVQASWEFQDKPWFRSEQTKKLIPYLKQAMSKEQILNVLGPPTSERETEYYSILEYGIFYSDVLSVYFDKEDRLINVDSPHIEFASHYGRIWPLVRPGMPMSKVKMKLGHEPRVISDNGKRLQYEDDRYI